jgi:hypothetical protein
MPDSDTINLFVGTAAIAGAFLGIFVTALLSRASATSTLRQNWINSLREVMSKFLTHAEKWIDIPDKISEEAYWAKVEFIGYVHQAKLFLNEKEKNHEELMSKMEGLVEKYGHMKQSSISYQTEKREISSLMQDILKEEWNRVRDGEILWSVNNFFKLIGGPSWFQLSRIRLFWLSIFILSIWLIYEYCSR